MFCIMLSNGEFSYMNNMKTITRIGDSSGRRVILILQERGRI